MVYDNMNKLTDLEIIDGMLAKYDPNVSQEVIDATTDPELKAFYGYLKTMPLEVIRDALRRRAIDVIKSIRTMEDKLKELPSKKLTNTLEAIEEKGCNGCGLSTKQFKEAIINELAIREANEPD